MDWFERVYNENYDVLYSIAKRELWAIRMTRISIDDVIQDTFLDLFKARKKLINHQNIGGWLVVTLRHNISQAYRGKAKIPISLESVKENYPGFEIEDKKEGTQSADANDAIERIQVSVESESIELLNRHYVDGLPLAELAREEGISEDAMKMKLYRIRKRIRKLGIGILTSIGVTFLGFLS